MRRKQVEVVRITSAREGRSVDIRSREIRYLVSMGVRTACFVAAIFTGGPLRWVLIAAAFLLPYFAVVIANAGARPDTGGPAAFDPGQLAVEAPKTPTGLSSADPRP